MRILIAYDYSVQSDMALQRGVDLASRIPGSDVHLVSVLDGREPATTDHLRDALPRRLRAVFEARQPDGDVEVFVHVRVGEPAEELLALAAEVGADLIVIGSHSRAPLGRLALGSVADAVVHSARCAVQVVRMKGYDSVALEDLPEQPAAMPMRFSYDGDSALLRTGDWPLN